MEIRPFNVKGLDLSAYVELQSSGKVSLFGLCAYHDAEGDQLSTVITFMDALVQDTDSAGEACTLLSLTSARSLVSRFIIPGKRQSQVLSSARLQSQGLWSRSDSYRQ